MFVLFDSLVRKAIFFDLETDAGQEGPVGNATVVARLEQQIIAIMRDHDVPPEASRRIELPVPEGARHAWA